MRRLWQQPGPGPNFAREARANSDITNFRIPSVANLSGWGCDEAAAAGARGVAAANGDDGGGGGGACGGLRRILLRPFVPRPPQEHTSSIDAEVFGGRSRGQSQQEGLPNSCSFDSRDTEVEFCRICRESSLPEDLITPCDCRGTVRFVHRTCLERWLEESDSNFCEICGYRYIVERKPRFGVLKAVVLWAISSYTEILLDLLAAASFVPLAMVGTSMGMAAGSALYYGRLSDVDEDGVASLVLMVEPNMGRMAAQTVTGAMLTVMAAMDIAVTAFLVMRIQQHTAHCYSWWRRHCMVRLIQPARQEQQLSNAKEPVEAALVTDTVYIAASADAFSEDSMTLDSMTLSSSSSTTNLRSRRIVSSKEM